jgi:hypothetical protein
MGKEQLHEFCVHSVIESSAHLTHEVLEGGEAFVKRCATRIILIESFGPTHFELCSLDLRLLHKLDQECGPDHAAIDVSSRLTAQCPAKIFDLL